MQTIRLIAILIFFAWFPVSWAQTPPSGDPEERKDCKIALPYQAELRSSCSPQPAAAYDFAFCSFYYIVASLAAPESDKSLGKNSKSQEFKRKGAIYANISTALSDADTLQKNSAFIKKYFESISKEKQLMEFSINYITQKCNNVEFHHAEVLNELIQRSKRQTNDGH